MTNLQKETPQLDTEQIQAAIKSYLEKKDFTREQLAIEVETSRVTIDKMLRTGANELSISRGLWKRVWNVVNPDLSIGIIQTNDCAEVFKAAKRARHSRYMIGITGDTGMGKTTAKEAIEQQPNTYSFYIDDTVTPRVFLTEISKSLGIWNEGNQHEMLLRVAKQLMVISEPLLIFDECAKMSASLMLTIHSLRDKTMRNCGMLLLGMPDFRNKLIKHVQKGTTGYAEFYRRINIWHELSGLSTKEINFVLEQHGITEAEEQRQFKNYKRFGDLMNEIRLYQSINEEQDV